MIARIRCASKVARPDERACYGEPRCTALPLDYKCPYTSPEYRVLRVEGVSCRGGSRRGFVNPERVSMLPSLVAAAPARILTSGQLGQPSGASPPSPRLTSNARGARGRPRDRPRARLTRERERLRRGARVEEGRATRGGPREAERAIASVAMASGARHSRASPSSPALCLPRARRDVVASRRAARGPSRARLPAPPPRATPVAEAEGTPSPRATPSAGAGAASPPPPPPRRRRDADPPHPRRRVVVVVVVVVVVAPLLLAVARERRGRVPPRARRRAQTPRPRARRVPRRGELRRGLRGDEARRVDRGGGAARRKRRRRARRRRLRRRLGSLRLGQRPLLLRALERGRRRVGRRGGLDALRGEDLILEQSEEPRRGSRLQARGVTPRARGPPRHRPHAPLRGVARIRRRVHGLRAVRGRKRVERRQERARHVRSDARARAPTRRARRRARARARGGAASSSSSSSSSDADALDALDALPDQMPLLNLPALALDLAEALAYLHASGFAHRDVKSSNVLLKYCASSRRVRARSCATSGAPRPWGRCRGAPRGEGRRGPSRGWAAARDPPRRGDPWARCSGWRRRCSRPRRRTRPLPRASRGTPPTCTPSGWWSGR